jgi:hypothetical protein
MSWRELAMAENGRAGQDKVVTIEAIGSSAVHMFSMLWSYFTAVANKLVPQENKW